MTIDPKVENLRKAQKKRNIDEAPEPGQYPTQHVFRTPGGIVRIESDDPNHIYTAEFHPAGWFRIIHADGSVVESTPGETKMEYGTQAVTVRHNQDVSVGGKLKLQIQGGAHITTAGDLAITAGQTGTINILGDAAIAVNGNARISAKKNVNLDSETGNLNLRAKGSLTLGSDSGIKIQSTKIEFQPLGDGNPGYDMDRSG